MIVIDIDTQTLTYGDKTYSISSAKNGVGEVEGSYCTPRGRFQIAEKIGHELPIGAVLVARKPTGETYHPTLAEAQPGRDWILTRILWLDGLDEANRNTQSRYIYIHGSPDEIPMGKPGSKGCIRMHSGDMIELFDLVDVGEHVEIKSCHS